MNANDIIFLTENEAIVNRSLDIAPCLRCRERLGRIFEQCQSRGHQEHCFAITLAEEAIIKARGR